MTAKPGTQHVIDRINQAIAAGKLGPEDGMFEIVAPVETSVLMKDRKFKTIPFKGGEEMILKGVRAGKRSEFIFEFQPVDDQPYTQVEFAEKKVFNALRNFENTAVRMLGFAGIEEFSWSDATAEFCARINAKLEADKAATERAAASVYDSNPNYGIF